MLVLPEIEPLVGLVPVLVLPDVREARVAEDEPVVAPRGVRVVGHVVAQHSLQKLSAVPVRRQDFHTNRLVICLYD